TQSDWMVSFSQYQKTPEFYELNPDMELEGYQGIFMLEYIHRVWGRTIGMIFLLPFLWFLVAGKIQKSFIPKFIIMFILGGMQGVLGWYMVKSGLADNPYVSQYRLTAHLMAAFAIFAYILWVAMGLMNPRNEASLYDVTPLRRYAIALTALIAVTVASGGFVAGLKAGFTFNTFPLMDGRFIPEGYAMLTPFWHNFFDNIAAVQFDHRILAETTILLIVAIFFYSRRFELVGRAKLAFHMMLGMGIIQVALGISTLVFVVPTALGVIHQGGAMVLFSTALFVVHSLGQPAEDV
ncbi:MAG: COX15/CtaA family protein, partial [Mariprofundaceae bacterium]